MTIRVLHIDDDPKVLDQVGRVISGKERNGYTLKITASEGFEEGFQLLSNNHFDLVLLDLCVGNASQESDKVGIEIFEKIKQIKFVPVVFFTGLAQNVEPLRSDVVGVANKGAGYDNLFAEIDRILKNQFIELNKEVHAIVGEGLRSFFWDFVHPHKSILDELKKDQVSHKYLLLRRLGKTIANELTKMALGQPGFSTELGHPMEYYIYPPIDGEFETGDIVEHKGSKEQFIIVTPSCDMILRGTKPRKAEKVLLVALIDFETSKYYQHYQSLFNEQKKMKEAKKDISKTDENKLSNSRNSLISLMGTDNERHFFLPPTAFFKAVLVDFQDKRTVDYIALENEFSVLATIDDPIVQAITAKYSRYYSRIGYKDLDREYVLGKMLGEI